MIEKRHLKEAAQITTNMCLDQEEQMFELQTKQN